MKKSKKLPKILFPLQQILTSPPLPFLLWTCENRFYFVRSINLVFVTKVFMIFQEWQTPGRKSSFIFKRNNINLKMNINKSKTAEEHVDIYIR